MQTGVQIVILAGGRGSRMGETDIPKVLQPLHGKPLILHLLENVKASEWDFKPIIVVGFKREQVIAALGPGFLYAIQEAQLGTGHAVQCALSQVTAKDILVLYGDMPFITATSLQKLIKLHKNSNTKLTMLTTIVSNFSGPYRSIEKYGRIIRDAERNIVAVREFKDAAARERSIPELNPGYYVFDVNWFKETIGKVTTENVQHEYYLTDMVALAINAGVRVASMTISPDEVLGVNTKTDLEIAHTVSNLKD